MSSDEQLMLKYKSGEEEAFVKLYNKYSPSVYAYIRRRLHPSEVEDFYQTVWRHLHEKRENYSDQPFAPWFFVMIRNLLTDEYRSAFRRKKLIANYLDQDDNSIDTSELTEIINSLPPETANLVRKYYLEGHTYEDLEKETGLSQMGLRKRLSRTVQGLKKAKLEAK